MEDTKVCPKCGGNGKIGGCSKCGKVKEILNDKVAHKVADDILLTEFKEPKFRYSSEKLAMLKDIPDSDSNFKSYSNNINTLIHNASIGVLPTRSIIITSPSGYGKSILIKTLRYLYSKSGIRIAPILTLEEFSMFYKNLMYTKESSFDILNNIKESKLIILDTINSNSTQLQSAIKNLLQFAENYDIAVILAVSAPIQEILWDLSVINDESLSYKFPVPILYWTNKF